MTEHDDTKPAGEKKPPAGLPDTPLPNPLDPPTRQLVAVWLTEMASVFAEDLAAGPSEEELAEHGIEREEWMRRTGGAIEDLRRDAALICEDQLRFSTAAGVRNVLQHAEQHALIGAGAALDAAANAVLPQRLAAFEGLVQQHKEEHGFHIQVVGGRGEPLPMPSFTYTEGLAERAGHPELVIVGAYRVAAVLLNDIGKEVLDGTRTVAAGEDLAGLLSGDYKLRVAQCPPALVAQTHPDPEHPTGVLQILLPDEHG
jgi:hypothetical protein